MTDEKTHTLGLAMIVKNGEHGLRTLFDSLPTDIFSQCVVVDTGSTDKTKKVASELGAEVHDYVDPNPVELPWGDTCLSDFSAAREASFSYMKTDYIMWLDADDYLFNAEGFRDFYWRDISRGQYDGFFMAYDYEHDERGNCTIQQGRVRIVRNGATIWRSPIHEVPCFLCASKRNGIPTQISRVIHTPHSKESIERKHIRNMLVAERRIKERDGEVEARLHMHYANGLLALGRYPEAIKHYNEFLRGSEWDGEKYHVLLSRAECERRMDELPRSLKTQFEAVALCPDYREAYMEIASTFEHMQEWKKALHWADVALDHKKNNLGYTGNPLQLRIGPWERKMNAHMHLLQVEEAHEAASKILEEDPGNERAVVQKSFISNLLHEQKLRRSYEHVQKFLALENDKEKIEGLRRAIPKIIQSSRARVKRRHGPSIIFLCGERLRHWGYDSIEKGGIGGSETAVIRMSEALASLGWAVTVYGWPADHQTGLFNGVEWRPHYEIDGHGPVDVFVNWRSTGFMAPVEASLKCVWCHDVLVPLQWNDTVIDYYDLVMVLSEAHKKDYAKIVPEEKLWVTRNGIDPSFWDHDVPKDPHRLVYASCPSRGLLYILDAWTEIRKSCPDARLDVYYGFTEWFRERMKTAAVFREIYDRVREGVKQDGIEWHGMVSQEKLGEAFSRAGFFPYPCIFPEISCINAMQAQATGAIPVTTGYWALSETVKHGIVVGGPEDRLDEQAALARHWLDELLELLGDERRQEVIRLEMTPWARTTFPWIKVAEEWNQKFRSILGWSPRASAVPTSSPASSAPSMV